MSNLANINSLVKNHLYALTENRQLNTWTVKKSDLEGRGLFANRDISIGEIIFVDLPLISGPRTALETAVDCVCCYRTGSDIVPRLCAMGCGLPVCSSDCENSSLHVAECKLVSSWNVTELRDSLDPRQFARNIVPLRALLLDEVDKDFLLSLATHDAPRHGAEVRFYKKYFEISNKEEYLMIRACRALDANAYEMLMTTKGNKTTNLRGLFPVAALMNHSCTPNIRSDFDAAGRMHVRASAFIPSGAEICTSYTNLLWGTPARRQHLMNTKHFLCKCARCADRSEFGTHLAALKCLDKTCNGVLLPADPLNFSSHWCCEDCGLEVSPRQIGALQSALASFVGSVNLSSPGDIYDFSQTKIKKFLPESNHIVLELKCRIISSIGVAEGWRWNELSVEWLNRVQGLCREVLRCLDLLQLSGAPRAPRMALQLHRCLLHKLIRLEGGPEAENADEILALEGEVVESINKCYEVLKHDLLAPKDVELRRNLANSDIHKLIEYEIQL